MLCKITNNSKEYFQTVVFLRSFAHMKYQSAYSPRTTLLYNEFYNFRFMDEVTIKGKQFKLIISEEQLQERIQQLAGQINEDYREHPPLIIPVLNGSFMFTADLIRYLTVQPELYFCKVSSYGDGMFGEDIEEIEFGNNIPLEDRHVLIIEDIVDTGYTSEFLRNHMRSEGCQSVKIISLLFKPDSFLVGPKPNYIGFEIPPAFVVGYGLDFAQQGRELRGVYQLK